MSYATMDHAGWVERNIAASKQLAARRQRSRAKKGWDAAPDKLSPFQARVFDILGIVGGGIYNAPISWNSVDWDGYGTGISLLWERGMSTFDFTQLTTLVFLCCEARIRCEVEPATFRALRLIFFPRCHVGSASDRHPNLAEAVNAFRAYVPSDHSIFYRPDPLESRRVEMRFERNTMRWRYDQTEIAIADDDGMGHSHVRVAA